MFYSRYQYNIPSVQNQVYSIPHPSMRIQLSSTALILATRTYLFGCLDSNCHPPLSVCVWVGYTTCLWRHDCIPVRVTIQLYSSSLKKCGNGIEDKKGLKDFKDLQDSRDLRATLFCNRAMVLFKQGKVGHLLILQYIIV